MMPMKQSSFDLSMSVWKTHNRGFLVEVAAVGLWAALVALIASCYPEGNKGRPPSALETIGYVKERFRSLKKNNEQLITLFALLNLWMARGQFMGAGS